MKSTDIARNAREFKRVQKKEEYIQGRQNRENLSVADYINQLHDMMHFCDQKIYGIIDNEDILMHFIEMKLNVPEKQWETIIRKAVRKTKVAKKEEAVKELLELLAIAD